MSASGDAGTTEAEQGTAAKSPLRRWGVPFVVVGAITAGIITLLSSGDPAARARDAQESRNRMAEASGGVYGNPEEASFACRDAVRDNLKAPSTAEFGEPKTTTAGKDWLIAGAVDAQNGYGAMIRSRYTCTVRGDANGSYSIVSVDMPDH